MPTLTTINVRGQARDSRLPDQACAHLHVRLEGHDWSDVHARMTQALSSLADNLTELSSDHPEAVTRTAISQVCQSNWTAHRVQTFAEEARASITFTDFDVMGLWLAGVASGATRVAWIDWELSGPVRDSLRRTLGEAAVKDARARAEVFATAAGLRIVGVGTLADPGLLAGSGNREPMRFFDGSMRTMAAPAMAMGAADEESMPSGYDLAPEPIETIMEVEAGFVAE